MFNRLVTQKHGLALLSISLVLEDNVVITSVSLHDESNTQNQIALLLLEQIVSREGNIIFKFMPSFLSMSLIFLYEYLKSSLSPVLQRPSPPSAWSTILWTTVTYPIVWEPT